MFLATPGSLEDIFLNFFAVGFIQSVDNLVVEALRKSPFSRDADQEWEVQVEYRTLPSWSRKAFVNVLGPFGYGLLCAFVYLASTDSATRLSISDKLSDHFGGRSWSDGIDLERIIRASLCLKKSPPTRTSPTSGSQTSSSSSAFH